jgi:hypothetical protein
MCGVKEKFCLKNFNASFHYFTLGSVPVLNVGTCC